MMKEFMKMMKDKQGNMEDMSSTKRDAKSKVLQELRDLMKGVSGENIKNLKKVTVASDSPEGIKAGLEKAGEMMEPSDEEPTQMSSDDSESEEESNEYEQMGKEELVAELEKIKAALQNKT